MRNRHRGISFLIFGQKPQKENKTKDLNVVFRLKKDYARMALSVFYYYLGNTQSIKI